MKTSKTILFVTMLVFLLAGCRNIQEPVEPTPTLPVQEVTPVPSPTAAPELPIISTLPSPSSPVKAPTQVPPVQITPTPASPTQTASTSVPTEPPVDYDEERQKDGAMATVEGFYHRPFEELSQELRDSLEWDGQVRTEPGYNFRLRRYTGPNIVITTTEATDEALRNWLDWQLSLPADDEAREGTDEELRAEYEREKGREWLYSVSITDGNYTTIPGLKVGNTVEEAEALGYPLQKRLNDDGEATFGDTWDHSLRVRVEDDVVKEMYLTWGIGRYTGKYWDL